MIAGERLVNAHPPTGMLMLIGALLADCRSSSLAGVGDLSIPSCLAPVKRVFVTDTGDWAQKVAGIPSLNAQHVVAVRSTDTNAVSVGWMTPWTMDQWVFGWRAGKPIVLEFPGERGLTEWGSNHFSSAGILVRRVGENRGYPENRFDAGGNVLVVPAASNATVAGAIITSAQIQPAIKTLLYAATPGGRLIELDTDWLKVGHVDEIVAFVPGRPGESFFRLVLPDPEAGLALLRSAHPCQTLFSRGRTRFGTVTRAGARFIDDEHESFETNRWAVVRILTGRSAGIVGRVLRTKGSRLTIDHCWDLRGSSPSLMIEMIREGRCDTMPIWFEPPEAGSRYEAFETPLMWLDSAAEGVMASITTGELAADPLLAEVARKVARRIATAERALVRELGILEKDIARLPVLFRGDQEGRNVTALAPNPINLVCMGRKVILLKPFGPQEEMADESSDVFLRAWGQVFRDLGLSPVFLDGWNELRRLEGGARCGINVQRLIPWD